MPFSIAGHRVARRARLEHDREQSGRAREVALPQLVPARAGQRRVQHLADFRTLAQPGRDAHRARLVPVETRGERAQPRRPRNASSDDTATPMSVHSRCIGSAVASLHTITPSSTSEWPPMYLVAACTDTSTPWSNARKPSGVAQELSSTTSAPCRCADLAIAGHVLDVERQRAGRLGEHDARVRRHVLLDAGAGQRIVERDLDAVARQRVRREPARRPVDRVGDQHAIAGPGQRDQRETSSR
jgi:hypothetical protein